MDAGAVFNTYLSGTDKNITCIADFAASMAFAILQECPRRVAMKHSILMQHEASYGLSSAPLPNQRSLVNLIERQISVMTAQQAHRMGMDLDKFKSKVRDDYWVYGFEALADGAVDSIEIVSCSKQLINTHVKVTRQSFFGPIEAVLSGCPLVSFPLEVSRGVWEPFKNLSGEEIKLINVIGE